MITTINAIVAAVNLLFVRERNQHLWEMLFAYLAEPRDIWVALRPFLLGASRCWSRWWSSSSAGLVTLATRHVRRLGRPPLRPVAPLVRPRCSRSGALALFALTMVQPITVKQVGGRPKTEIAWIASRHQMVLDDYVLNQAVVNPLWDLIREYLPVVDLGRAPAVPARRPRKRSRSPSACSASPRAIGRIRSCARCAGPAASGSGTWC